VKKFAHDLHFATLEEQFGPALLCEVSEETGVACSLVDNPNDRASIATRISIELRDQYVLGYRPMNPKYDGKWDKIKVKLSLPKGMPQLEAHARQGYCAPEE